VHRRGGRSTSRIACQKRKVVPLKAPSNGPETVPSENAKCSVSEVQQPPQQQQPARRMEPVPRRSRLLLSFSLSLSLSLSRACAHSRSLGLSLLCSNRAVDPSQLEVTTGHRLNQSKPRFISPPLSPAVLSVSHSLSLSLSLSFSLLLARLALFLSYPHLARGLILGLSFLFLPRRSPFTWTHSLSLSLSLSLLPVSSRPGSSIGRRCQGTHGPELNQDRCGVRGENSSS